MVYARPPPIPTPLLGLPGDRYRVLDYHRAGAEDRRGERVRGQDHAHQVKMRGHREPGGLGGR